MGKGEKDQKNILISDLFLLNGGAIKRITATYQGSHIPLKYKKQKNKLIFQRSV